MTFKIGDIVKTNNSSFSIWDQEVRINQINSLASEFKIDGHVHWIPMNMFEKVLSPLEKARKVLEDAGYIITDPSPKKTGEVAVYEDEKGHTLTISKEEWDKWGLKYYYKLLAIIPWTEGDGLPE